VNAAVWFFVYRIRLASGREVEASKSGAQTTTQGFGDLADWWLMDKGSQGVTKRFSSYTVFLHFCDNTHKD
jgi:hypothetical protein